MTFPLLGREAWQEPGRLPSDRQPGHLLLGDDGDQERGGPAGEEGLLRHQPVGPPQPHLSPAVHLLQVPLGGGAGRHLGIGLQAGGPPLRHTDFHNILRIELREVSKNENARQDTESALWQIVPAGLELARGGTVVALLQDVPEPLLLAAAAGDAAGAPDGQKNSKIKEQRGEEKKVEVISNQMDHLETRQVVVAASTSSALFLCRCCCCLRW